MAVIIKVCKVHGELTMKDLKVGIYKNKNYRKCKHCELDRSRKYHAKKYQDKEWIEKKHATDKKRYETKKDEINKKRQSPEALQKRRETYKKYGEKYRENFRQKQKKYREELHDSYVKRVIRNGDKKDECDMPQSMIDLKKVLLQAKRVITKARIDNPGETKNGSKKYRRI